VSTAAPLVPSQRVLVQLVTLASTARPGERALYRSIEWGAELVGWRYLRRAYRHRVLLHGPSATLDGLVEALAAASAEPDVAAVDLLINPHGTSRQILFADGPVDSYRVCVAIRERLGPEQRRCLRATFSTACYGMSHTDAWLRCGFCVAVGSRGIYADGVTSLPHMLRAWASGSTVEQAVDEANAADRRRWQDAVAARHYRRTGRAAQSQAVDSERVADGARTMVITTDPAQWRPRRLPT
jgi:hypothetical protein